MRIGLPGTWLAVKDLEPGGEPTGREADRACREPRIWDNRDAVWRHLRGGSPCRPGGHEQAVG
jgi:hypothetical protein